MSGGRSWQSQLYSVAMLLLEQASRQDIRATIQVFGSDIDAKALAMAREGQYPAAIEADVSEDRLRRFFLKEGDHYRVRQNCATWCCSQTIDC